MLEVNVTNGNNSATVLTDHLEQYIQSLLVVPQPAHVEDLKVQPQSEAQIDLIIVEELEVFAKDV